MIELSLREEHKALVEKLIAGNFAVHVCSSNRYS